MPTTPNLTPAQAAAAKLASLSPQMRGVLSSMPPAAPMPEKDAVTPGSMLRKPMPAAGRPNMMNQGMRPGMRPFAKGGDVGGGRSAGRGGPTVEELQDYEEEGIFTERKQKRGDYGNTKEAPTDLMPKKPQAVKKLAKGGSVGSASRRADGCAQRGKTKGRIL